MTMEVVIYACQQAVPNPDFLKTQWGQETMRLRVLSEPCSSKIEAFQLLRTLANPADLVWVIGCAEDLCRYNEGSHRLGNRIAYTRWPRPAHSRQIPFPPSPTLPSSHS